MKGNVNRKGYGLGAGSVLCLLILLLSLCLSSAVAEGTEVYTSNNFVYYILEDGTACIKGYIGYDLQSIIS